MSGTAKLALCSRCGQPFTVGRDGKLHLVADGSSLLHLDCAGGVVVNLVDAVDLPSFLADEELVTAVADEMSKITTRNPAAGFWIVYHLEHRGVFFQGEREQAFEVLRREQAKAAIRAVADRLKARGQ